MDIYEELRLHSQLCQKRIKKGETMRKLTPEEQKQLDFLCESIEKLAKKYNISFEQVIEKLKNPYGITKSLKND
jgi:Mor family transcriptional regulator